MDYHIEISSLVQFVNDQLRQKFIVHYNAREIYNHIKKAVLDSETKPFLYPLAEGENNSMYEKYEKMNAEWDGQYIPDFFEHEGAFYDLDKIQYAFRENTREETFRILFSLKIGELKSNDLPINEFLSFQVFDNFYGDKKELDVFLQELLAIDGNFYLFPSNFDEIKEWINRKEVTNLEITGASIEKDDSHQHLSSKDEKETALNENQLNFIKLLHSKQIIKMQSLS